MLSGLCLCVLVLRTVSPACVCFVCALVCDVVYVAAASVYLCVLICVWACCLRLAVMFDGLLLLLCVFACVWVCCVCLRCLCDLCVSVLSGVLWFGC